MEVSSCSTAVGAINTLSVFGQYGEILETAGEAVEQLLVKLVGGGSQAIVNPQALAPGKHEPRLA